MKLYSNPLVNPQLAGLQSDICGTMEGKIRRYMRRYNNVCTPSYMAAMVFSNIQTVPAVLKTLEVITGNDPIRPGSR
jgi:hypothetical protein